MLTVSSALCEDILSALNKVVEDKSRLQWLQTKADGFSDTSDLTMQFAIISGQTKRKLGDALISDQGVFAHWRTDQLARFWLLLKAMLLVPQTAQVEQFKTLYAQGDDEEKIAWLMGIFWLDPDGELHQHVVHAGRTNSQAFFAAICQCNPYPARHYSEQEFNQLVLKTLFLDLDISKIVDLTKRSTPGLIQVLTEFKQERFAANRSVPANLEPVIKQLQESLL